MKPAKSAYLLFLMVPVLLLGDRGFAATVNYTYDDLNRLTRVDYSSGNSIEYSYDEIGNRTALTSRRATRLTTIKDSKSAGDDWPVSISSCVVTAALPGFFYIEADDRSCGIRVECPDYGMVVGNRSVIYGTTKTNTDGERYILAESATPEGSGSILPLGLTNKAIGGTDWRYNPDTGAGQKGVKDGAGLNTIGLLLRTTGKVTLSGSNYMIIDDGSGLIDASGHPGLRVEAAPGLKVAPTGVDVTVTGVSSCYRQGEEIYRLLLVRSQEDIALESGAVIEGEVLLGSLWSSFYTLESPHPYPDNCEYYWRANFPVGTSNMRIHFARLELEKDYDWLCVWDDNLRWDYSGLYSGGGWTDWYDGDTLLLGLFSDESYHYYGFLIDEWNFTVPSVPAAGVTVSLAPGNQVADTDQQGRYVFANLPPGTYTLTPLLDRHSFAPISRKLVVSDGDWISARFVACPVGSLLRKTDAPLVTGIDKASKQTAPPDRSSTQSNKGVLQ